MHKLIAELTRLYLLSGQRYSHSGGFAPAPGYLAPAELERHVLGEQTLALNLLSEAGFTRTLVIDFKGGGEQHWQTLCDVANALQTQLGLPAPAVSISGAGYGLWLSLETPMLAAQAHRLLQLLRSAYFPDATQDQIATRPDGAAALVELPPCLHQPSGLWAAFINPGMGASFAEEPGLEMAPPASAQAAFLEGLHSITLVQFKHALSVLQQKFDALPQAAVPATSSPAPAASSSMATPDDLLLKDATLEDIIRFLHAKNIEPTFRHVLPGMLAG